MDKLEETHRRLFLNQYVLERALNGVRADPSFAVADLSAETQVILDGVNNGRIGWGIVTLERFHEFGVLQREFERVSSEESRVRRELQLRNFRTRSTTW